MNREEQTKCTAYLQRFSGLRAAPKDEKEARWFVDRSQGNQVMNNERVILLSALFAVTISGSTDFSVAQIRAGALEEIVVTAPIRSGPM